MYSPNIHFILICFFLLPSALSWMPPFCNRAHPTHNRFNSWVRVKYVGIDKRHISKARRRASEASADRSQTTTSYPRMNNQESNNLENSPTLVLNADYTPLSYIPLSVWCWQDTLRAVFSGKAVVVAEYSNLLVRSVSCSFKLPSVIALKEYHKKPSSSPVMSKRYVFIRDNFRCQVIDTKAAVDTSLLSHPHRTRLHICWCSTVWSSSLRSCFHWIMSFRDAEAGSLLGQTPCAPACLATIVRVT